MGLAARTLGFVFKEVSLRKISPQHGYFFLHKTFQEYLAAFYLINRLLKQKIDLSELHLDFYWDLTWRYRQVFIFMSGILGEEAGLLFKQIGKKLKNGNWDWHERFKREATFFHVCFSEGRNYEQVAMVLCSFIPFPQTIAIDLSNEERSTELFIILNSCTSFSQLQLPVHLAIIRLNDEVYANLDDDLLAYFMASNTWLQTLCFSVRVIREKTTTLLCKVLKVVSTAYSFTLETTGCISSDEVVAIKLPCEI